MSEIVVEAPRHWLRRDQLFWPALRKITGQLDQVQVETIKALLVSDWAIGFVAYALATAWHECRLRPIHELGGDRYLAKYDTGPLAAALGNTPQADGDGQRYAGRGLVQLTGRHNYQQAGQFLGLDLLGNPELALDPEVAARILIWGMGGGHFTGKKLGDFIVDRGTHAAFVRCRWIINGQNCAEKIANYADQFQEALDQGDWK